MLLWFGCWLPKSLVRYTGAFRVPDLAQGMDAGMNASDCFNDALTKQGLRWLEQTEAHHSPRLFESKLCVTDLSWWVLSAFSITIFFFPSPHSAKFACWWTIFLICTDVTSTYRFRSSHCCSSSDPSALIKISLQSRLLSVPYSWTIVSFVFLPTINDFDIHSGILGFPNRWRLDFICLKTQNIQARCGSN